MQRVLEKSGEAAYIESMRDSMDTLLEHIPSGILTMDHKGNITSLNHVAQELLGLDNSQVEGASVTRPPVQRVSEFFRLLEYWLNDVCGNYPCPDHRRIH